MKQRKRSKTKVEHGDHAHYVPEGSIDFPIIGVVGIGKNMQRRLQTMCVFWGSLYNVLFFVAPLCMFLTYKFICNVYTAPFMIGYLVWIFAFDKSPVKGDRTPFLRGAPGNWYWRNFAGQLFVFGEARINLESDSMSYI